MVTQVAARAAVDVQATRGRRTASPAARPADRARGRPAGSRRRIPGRRLRPRRATRPSSAFARTTIEAPSRRGDTAYLTLFSTSVCSAIRGTSFGPGAVAQVDRVAQPIAEAHPFDVEIGADDAQLLVERDERRRRAVERRAQQRGELPGHPLGAGRIVVHERGDRVQRVEQEVRLHARLDRGELRLGGEPARLGLVALLGPQRERSVSSSWPRSDLVAPSIEDAEDQRDDERPC